MLFLVLFIVGGTFFGLFGVGEVLVAGILGIGVEEVKI